VVLIDPVPAQVQEARRHGTFDAHVGDARDLQFEDDSFDVALLFGPLYHLAAANDRLRSLRPPEVGLGNRADVGFSDPTHRL